MYARCTDEKINSVVEGINSGLSYYGCANLAQVTAATLIKWLDRGRIVFESLEEELYDEVPVEEIQYYKLYAACMQANGNLEGRLVKSWILAADSNWMAAERLLERRFKESWGNPDKTRTSNNVDEDGNEVNQNIKVEVYLPSNGR